MEKMMDNINLLIDKYVESILAGCEVEEKDLEKVYAESILVGREINEEDLESAKTYYSEAVRCLCEIKRIPNWTKSFLKLLEHEDAKIRIHAAVDLLPYETKKAKKCLKKCRQLTEIEGRFEAKVVLEIWKTGEIEFAEYDEKDKIVNFKVKHTIKNLWRKKKHFDKIYC